MQDVRLRVAAAAALSAASYLSVVGAAFTLLWWLLFTGREKALPGRGVLASFLLMILAVAGANQLGGGDGLSYAVRMVPLILIAGWLSSERVPGELLHAAVWLFGPKTGFDLGLVAEMGLQAMGGIGDELERMRRAMRLKGRSWGVRAMVPAGLNLMQLQIARSAEQAQILALRGYRRGGSLDPVFKTTARDSILFFSALLGFLLTLCGLEKFL
ncbi:MAG TPA: hypothetical protein ENN85_07200 [Methanoculleus sp.]|nr:hypothetical protein [Methanoculleus sp.]